MIRHNVVFYGINLIRLLNFKSKINEDNDFYSNL